MKHGIAEIRIRIVSRQSEDENGYDGYIDDHALGYLGMSPDEALGACIRHLWLGNTLDDHGIEIQFEGNEYEEG